MTSTLRRAKYKAEIRASDLEHAIIVAVARMRAGRIEDARATLERAVPESIAPARRPKVFVAIDGGAA